MRDKGLSGILITGFGVGMLWDFVTTFLGVTSIVAGPDFTVDNADPSTFGVYGIALVGTVIVFCFNLITVSVWEDAITGNLVLVSVWFLSIVFDFITSLAGNYKFIVPGRQDEIGVLGIIWFTTILTTISPMTVRYLWLDFQDS